MMALNLVDRFYKGPITSCEHYDPNTLLIGCGPFLSVIDSVTFEVRLRCLALKYRVIHKIIVSNVNNEKTILIIGQKAINILKYAQETNEIQILASLELDDWIFDAHWISQDRLGIVCAHNQYIQYNLTEKKADQVKYCDQKCMLYSAKIVQSGSKHLIASGTIYNQVLIWSPESGEILSTLTGHQGVIFNIHYHYSIEQDVYYLFTTSDDRSINTWLVKFNDDLTAIVSSSLYTRLYGHEARVWKCVSLTSNDNRLFLCSIGEDLNCCLWNVDEKKLVYRFQAMRKGTKNIWSLCLMNRLGKLELVTGWADGGLRKIDLEHYVNVHSSESNESNSSSTNLVEHLEWNLEYENEKDFVRNILVLDGRLICCTNLGALYLVETAQSISTPEKHIQKLLFKSILLTNYTCMSKTKLNVTETESAHWLLTIGTLKGFIYLLNIKFDPLDQNHIIKIDCLNSLGLEEELAAVEPTNLASSIIKSSLKTPGSSKIFNLIWFTYKPIGGGELRYFLLACFSLMNGLSHLYEFDSVSGQLNLIARLYLPTCKHRWFTCFSIVSIKNVSRDESVENDNNQDAEEIVLCGGDKSGNMHLYRFDRGDSSKEADRKSDNDDQHSLNLVKPVESLENVTKENSAISGIYAKPLESFNESWLNFLLIVSCKDGFYRLFEFHSGYFIDDINDQDDSIKDIENEDQLDIKKTAVLKKTMLKLVNKYQVNSYIDLIESFIFDSSAAVTSFDSTNLLIDRFLRTDQSFMNQDELDYGLKLASCFYGDRFLLWNFQLNRALFEFRCGGANRSWDTEFATTSETNGNDILFKFFYVKNKSIGEARKLVGRAELERPHNQNTNHLCQMFHGNTISDCKFLLSNSRYLVTGAEDTQLIVTRLDKSNTGLSPTHLYRLQGHDSVVKCMDFMQLNAQELLLCSAGGKANIKLWKVILNEPTIEENEPSINRIVQLSEFKRFLSKRHNQLHQKPWLYIDLTSNPDIRFMDVCLIKTNANDSFIHACFACSDGQIRIFRFDLITNKIHLINRYKHSHCLLCIRHLRVQEDEFLLSTGTDGSLLIWPFNITDEIVDKQTIGDICQSGINDLDVWQERDEVIVACVGDDTRLSIVNIEFKKNNSQATIANTKFVIKKDMAHASCIVGVRFLTKDLLVTVSKDQRLILWRVDYDSESVNSLSVLFFNVADVASLDVAKIKRSDSDFYRVALVGVGMEILDMDVSLFVESCCSK